jgi:hypothetical protein
MRFELFLTELPKASTARVQSALAELPKGASTGTILKSMEARKVPTVSVAWSDDKRVLNEVMDTLVELGAGVKLLDHGSLVQKLATFIAEKAGSARYLADDDDPESRKYIKMGRAKSRESFGEALTRHALSYFLQLVVAGVLFIWYVALRVGMERVFTTPGLWPQFFACALGLLVAYVCSGSVRAVQTGQLGLLRALPQLILGGALTVASLFFLETGSDTQTVADGKVKRPPSLPYSGLISELRNRKLAREASGRDGDENGDGVADLDALAAEEEALAGLWCEKPEPVEAAECEAGAAWEDALACLPKPTAVAAVAKKTRPVAKRQTGVRDELPTAPPAEPLLETPPAEQPWRVLLQLSTVLALAGMWFLSLLGMFLQLRARAPTSATPIQEEETFAASATSRATPQAAGPREVNADEQDLATVQRERDDLLAALEATTAALAQAQAAAKAEPTANSLDIADLQRELDLPADSLEADPFALGELKRELAQATVRETELKDELTQRLYELSQAFKERDQARATLAQLAAQQAVPTGRAENDGRERTTGLTRQLPDDADDRSYSVNQVQEERVVLGKRRRP